MRHKQICLTAAIFGSVFMGGHPALTADLSKRAALEVMGSTNGPRTVVYSAYLVPYCLNTPEWLLPSEPLLRCAPRAYFQPEEPASLNALQATRRSRGPYLELYRQH